MKFLPYEKMVFHAPFPKEEVIDRLNDYVDERSRVALPFTKHHKAFKGRVSPTDFRVQRIIHYRNPAHPIITGHFQDHFDHTSVHLTIRLPSIVYLVAMGIGGLLVLSLIRNFFLADEPVALYEPLLSIGSFVLVIYLLANVPFQLEKREVVPILVDAIGVEPTIEM